jgi:heptosyltransferase-2
MYSNSFLIIQTAFLGDAILATALAESIHAQNPDHEITLLVRKGNETLFNDHPFIKEVLVWDKRKSKTTNLFKVISKVRSKRYDVVINLQRFFSTGLITVLSGARKKVGFDKNPLSFCFTKKYQHAIGDGTHEVDRNIELLGDEFSQYKKRPKIYPGSTHFEKVKQLINEPYVVLAPASVWKTKQLPEEKWIELGKLCKSEYQVVLTGSPDDFDLCSRLSSKIGIEGCTITAGEFSLMDSAALIQGSAMTYVNDSGPLHIASATNAPVTAFFCSTIPAFGFGPLSDKSNIIESKIKPECKPCGIHGKKACPLEHFNCGNGIEISKTLLP